MSRARPTRNMDLVIHDDSIVDHNSLLNYRVEEHREIDDSGIADTDLWSAKQIISEFDDVDTAIAALDAAKENSVTWGDGLQNPSGTASVDLVASGGLKITSGEIEVDDANVDHNALTNYLIAQHRTINDSGTAVTDLWSADKIITELAAEGLKNIVEDETPQLGGDLDANGHNIQVDDDFWIGFSVAGEFSEDILRSIIGIAPVPDDSMDDEDIRHVAGFVREFVAATPAGRIVFDDQATDEINFMDCVVGINVADPDTRLEILDTSAQLKLSYDGSNYITFAVQSDGDLTIDSNEASYNLDLGDGNLVTSGKFYNAAIKTIEVSTVLTSLGYKAGADNAGAGNVFIGEEAGLVNTSGNEQVGVGERALYKNTEGYINVALGSRALYECILGEANLAAGYKAGYNCLGNANIFLGYKAGYNETGSSKLYIENSDSATPLIYGDFVANLVGINGKLGVGEMAPETLVELSSTTPYLTIHNTTDEDIEGGREGKIIFKGEQSGEEETTLAVIQASHDGTGDDQKGDLIFHTNDGNDGDAPTERMRIDSVGNVGIGTTAPSGKLSVRGGLNGNMQIDITNSNSAVISNQAASQIYTSGGDGSGIFAAQGNLIIQPRTSAANRGIHFFTGSTTPSPRMSILDTGNIGIGVTGPDTKLEVFKAGTQLKLSYDATNYATFAVQSDGDLTIDSNKASYNLDFGDGNLITTGTLASGQATTGNHYPSANDTYYLGKNDDDSPLAWKGVILKDTTDGKYYRIEVINGTITATDLTD